MRKMTNAAKKRLIGTLVAVVMLLGMAVMMANAQDNQVIIPDATKDIQYVPVASVEYSQTKVPVKQNYVFGGWYKKADNADTFTTMNQKPTDTDENVYAKFVPAYVLSVKTQIDTYTAEKGAATDQNATMRVLSAVDDRNYKEVGFEVWLGKRTSAESTPVITTVYSGLKMNETDTEVITPEATFGAAADYFSALDLKNITKNSHKSIIYVRPYWVTLDGTKVEGMARNVHVEDEYLDYISVPVNVLSGESMAAGMLTMTYDKDSLDVVGFEAGRLFELDEMLCHVDEKTGTIKVVGNATTLDENVAADGLIANIRFKEKEGKTISDGVVLTQTNQDFCDWLENTVTVKIWDYLN